MKVGSFVRGLRGSTDWRAAHDELEKHLSARPKESLAVAAALDDELASGGYDIAVSSIRQDVFEIACRNPRREATAVAIELGARTIQELPAVPTREYVRPRNAMQLVGTRPASEISAALERNLGVLDQDLEFGLLLIHELVLRGEPLPANSDRYVGWAERTHHPLALLPVALLEVEREISHALPHYSGSARASGWPLVTGDRSTYVPLQDLLPGLGAPLSADTSQVQSLFREWLEHSNGRVQVDVYGVGSSFPSEIPPPRLHGDRPATLVPASGAVRSLFTAASSGGAYSHGPGGAYSRLWVWTAIAAIVDHPWPSSVRQIADLAEQSRWIELRIDDEWFDDVAWDLWLVTDDGSRVVAIAATDTD